MSEFMTIGEPMTVFASQHMDQSLADSIDFKKYLAGAELNVAVGLTRLGRNTDYISQVGDDPDGQFIKQQLKQNKIGEQYVRTSDNFHTGIMFKNRVSDGDPSIYYIRQGSAASHYQPNFIDAVNFDDVKIMHLTGIMAGLSATSFSTLERLFQIAKEKAITTTFDPNIRPALWSSEEEMIQKLNSLAFQSDIVLPGIKEGKLLMGSSDPSIIADYYLNNGAKYVVVKLGAEGAYIKGPDIETVVSGFKVKEVVDTVGAGDGFAVGLIDGLLAGLSIEDAVRQGNAIGSLAVQASGDSEGYPTDKQLQQYMNTYKEGK